MKTLFLNTLFILISISLYSQSIDRNNAVYIDAYKKIDRIYAKLIKAIGDTKQKKPKLEIWNSEKYVAAFSKDKNLIFIETKALEICNSFDKDSDDALAFLLGHELAHFYQNHNWDMGFATSFLTEKETFDSKCKNEQEADTYGAFMAYLCGYNIFEVAAPMLEKVYTVYNVPEKINRYPSLEERKTVASKAKTKAKDLIRIYEFANYCTAAGRNIQAKTCYDYLLNFIKTKEIYNNAGLATLAIGLSNKECMKYPITLDLSKIITLRAGYEYFDGKKDLAEKAISYFRRAQNMDMNYIPARINKAIAYTLLDDPKGYDTAIDILKKAESLSVDKTDRDKISLVKAIISFEQGNKENALKMLKDIEKNTADETIKEFAVYNAEIIQGKDCEQIYMPQISIEDKIDGIDIKEISEAFENKILLIKEDDRAFYIAFEQKDNSLLTRFIIDNDGSKTLFYLHRATSSSLKTKEGIKKGTSHQHIRDAYADCVIIDQFHSKGKIVQILNRRLIFLLNIEGKVTEWSLSN